MSRILVLLTIWGFVRVPSFDMVDVLDFVDGTIPPFPAWYMVTMNKYLVRSYKSLYAAIAEIVAKGEGQI